MNRKKKEEEYRRILAGLRDSAREEERDWEEADWKRAVRQATVAAPEDRRPFFGWNPRRVWAYGLIFLTVLGLAGLAVRIITQGTRPFVVSRTGPAGSAGPSAAGPGEEQTPQSRLSMTLISNESGLRVYWYFNKDFDWKEEKQ
jgi:hypothetical protein